MRILYLGDVMAEPGLELLERELHNLRQELQLDVVVAQAENLSSGKGIRKADFDRLLKAGVDFCTGGNHTFYRDEIYTYLNLENKPIVRPANYPDTMPGREYKFLQTPKGAVLVVSILGQIVGKDADLPLKNPLKTIDEILKKEQNTPKIATIVNFHGDFSSEKVVFGHYLDGRVSMVVGDHWHVPTNDARVQQGGTAHMSDVGMCGILDSSLGVSFDSIIPRWRDGVINRNVIETKGPLQMNGLLADIDETTGLATEATAFRRIFTV